MAITEGKLVILAQNDISLPEQVILFQLDNSGNVQVTRALSSSSEILNLAI